MIQNIIFKLIHTLSTFFSIYTSRASKVETQPSLAQDTELYVNLTLMKYDVLVTKPRTSLGRYVSESTDIKRNS